MNEEQRVEEDCEWEFEEIWSVKGYDLGRTGYRLKCEGRRQSALGLKLGENLRRI